jgi:hypothetical protein
MEFELSPRLAGSATLNRTAGGWQMDLPAGLSRTYRLAELDDYANSSRNRLKYSPPWSFSLRARLSSADLPGTWGFGLWNDPFGLSLGFGGQAVRLPALPQTVWFMHASPPNWLTLRDDPIPASGQAIPANGFFAGTFRSPRIPSLVLLPGMLILPLCAIRPISRLLRRLASRIVRQDAIAVNVDVTQWHEYSLQWLDKSCTFSVDGSRILETPCSPRPPLGLVIWIDNQYAAWTPQGQLAYGTLENPAARLEIENLTVQHKIIQTRIHPNHKTPIQG